MTNAVELKDVGFSYNSIPALEGITFSVGENDFLGIVGPNGGGKSTLLKIILGLLKPMTGSVTVFGQAPEEARMKIGYVPQTATFDRHFPITVLEVALMGRLGKRGIGQGYTAEDEEKARDALRKVGMLGFSGRQISQLSGGQLQRVLLARALVAEPGLLLLDEPMSSVDPDAQRKFYELLIKLRKQMAIMIVTHDITGASLYIEKLACLNVNLYYHGKTEGGLGHLEDTYKCPVELIAHGMPHRVLKRH